MLLVYGTKCPLCNAYCRAARVRQAADALRLIDARESSAVLNEITRKSLDIDQGMVVKIGDTSISPRTISKIHMESSWTARRLRTRGITHSSICGEPRLNVFANGHLVFPSPLGFLALQPLKPLFSLALSVIVRLV